jgi:ATP-binding cassette subfamily F protein 3
VLQITDVTYRIEGRLILDGATVTIPYGHKVGLVGRNGTGKTTLLKLVLGDLSPETGTIEIARGHRLGHVAQEAPGGDMSILDWVLSTDTERTALLAEAETATDPQRIADIQERLATIGAHTAPSRAAQILAGLGFDVAAQARPCAAFSGGWRMRAALASVLFLEPEVLLLDEPTNYLDLEGALWLERELARYPHTIVIVSHDRDLLNRSVGAILHLDRHKLTLYAGGYDAFEARRAERLAQDLDAKRRQDTERRRIQAFVDRFKAKATKAAQAQSRIKLLAKMTPIVVEADRAVAPILLPSPAKQLASPLIRLEHAATGYDPERPVLTRLDLRIDHDDRIALLGQNGNGKSTFAKLIAGRLPACGGKVLGANRVDVAYFAQHQLDDLAETATPYDYVARLMPEATEAQKRSKLGAFGFSIDKADTQCRHLSGGEKARLLLALTAFHGPHLLILDEPTNHLDIDSREALIHALSEYDGAVILISHDRRLIEACADRLWIVRGGTVAAYDGDLDAYTAEMLAERGGRDGPSRGGNGGGSGPAAGGDRGQERRVAAQRRAELAPLKKAMQAAEKRVETLTADIARIDAALADPDLYTREADKARRLTMERGQMVKRLAEAEEAWLLATDAYEQAERAVA